MKLNEITWILRPRLSYRVWKVWRRDADVFKKTYKTAFLAPLLEPLLYFAGLGFGLGGFVQQIDSQSYIQFIAPGLISISIMFASFYECAYGSFVRMYFQKTFDAIIATTVNIEEVIAGELLWGATKSLINSSIVLGVVVAFRLATSPLLLLVLPISFLAGLLFAAISMCFTAVAPNIDALSYPNFLLITPMFLFSGTFFPLTALPESLRLFAQLFLPLTHVVILTRALILGRLEAALLLSLAWLLVTTPIFFLSAIHLMRRRLIK